MLARVGQTHIHRVRVVLVVEGRWGLSLHLVPLQTPVCGAAKQLWGLAGLGPAFCNRTVLYQRSFTCTQSCNNGHVSRNTLCACAFPFAAKDAVSVPV